MTEEERYKYLLGQLKQARKLAAQGTTDPTTASTNVCAIIYTLCETVEIILKEHGINV